MSNENLPEDNQAKSTQSRSQIHLVGGRKGGVGKTFLSRHLAEYLTQQKQQFSLIEADVTVGDVGTVYGGYSEGQTTAAIDLNLSDDPKRYGEPDIIFQEATKKERVLVNLPAETNDALARWMKSVNLIELCEEGNIDLYLWFVTDGCYSSIRLLAESLKMLDGKLPHIIIRNEGRLNGSNFSYLEAEPLYQEIVVSRNIVCIQDFPVLGSAEQFYLDKHELTYEKGVDEAKKNLGLIQAQRIKTFGEEAVGVMNAIFNVDIPEFDGKTRSGDSAAFNPAPNAKNRSTRKASKSKVDAPSKPIEPDDASEQQTPSTTAEESTSEESKEPAIDKGLEAV